MCPHTWPLLCILIFSNNSHPPQKEEVSDTVADVAKEASEFFDFDAGVSNAADDMPKSPVGNEGELESNALCLLSEDIQVNQLIQEQVRFVREGDDIYHLERMSWKSSDENNSLPPVEKVVYYEDGSPAGCFFNECLCSLCDEDPTAHALDCTETPEYGRVCLLPGIVCGGDIIECGSDESEAIKNNSGPYSCTFDFGVIVKTPVPDSNTEDAAAEMKMTEAGDGEEEETEANSSWDIYSEMTIFIAVVHLGVIMFSYL